MSERPVLVKICGIRTLDAAQAAVDAGADLLGFICYPAARRYLPPEQVAAILEKLRNRSSVQAVGVFVNQPVEEMNAVATLCGLDLLQLSGNEPSELVSLLNRPVIKAFRPGDHPPVNVAVGEIGARLGRSAGVPPAQFGARRTCQALRCGDDTGAGGTPALRPATSNAVSFLRSTAFADSYVNGRANGTKPTEAGWSGPFPGGWEEVAHVYAALLEPRAAGWGGAGEQLDWSIARAITELAARPPVFLAGGLRPENVAQAIAAVRPDGVDVSSGVEVNGIQDCTRIAAFVAAAKGGAT